MEKTVSRGRKKYVAIGTLKNNPFEYFDPTTRNIALARHLNPPALTNLPQQSQ